jgi:hypothetical protein
MPKLEYMLNGDTIEASSDIKLAFFCPGCECHHAYTIKAYNNVGPTWQWNNSMDKPTFSPSLLVNFTQWDEEQKVGVKRVCHLFMNDGKIQFLSDCTHKLAGTTVDMLDVEV